MRKIWKRAAFLGLGAVFLGLLGGCFLFAPPSVPQGVSASDGDYPDRILVSWNPVRGAQRYEVFRAESEEGDYAKIGESTTTTFSDTEAQGNRLYWYRVRACNQFGCSALSEPDSGYYLAPLPPLPPQNVEASDGTFSDRIRVTWSAAVGASHYELYRSDIPGADFLRIAQVSTTSYDDRAIVLGRTYYYRVKACNSYGCSDFSETDAGFAAASVPGAPQNVEASDGTYSDRVRITWSPVPGANHYEVHRATARDGTYELIGETTTTTYDDTAVTVGTTYWYKVRAWNVLGYGPFSDPDSGYAAAAGGGGGGGGGTAQLPGQPRNLAATDGTYSDKIVITWSAATGAKRYEVWRAPATGPADPAETTYKLIGETTSTSYTDTEPKLCELYWYKVRAWNENGFGPWSFPDSGYISATLGTVDASKIKIGVLPPFGGSDYRVYLEWPNIKNADKYKVVYEVWRRSLPGYFTKIGEAPLPTDLDEPATYTDATVTAGSTYYYKIRAVSPDYADLLLPGGSSCSTCGDCILPGNFSAEVSVVVTCNPLPPELKTVTYDQTNKKVTITWTDPYEGTPAEGEATYEVWRSTSADSGYSKIVSGISDTTYTDADPFSGLTPGKTYTLYYRVKTCFACGCGVFSNTKSVKVTVP